MAQAQRAHTALRPYLLRAARPLGEVPESWLGAEEAPRALEWALLPQRALQEHEGAQVGTGLISVGRRHTEGLGWQLTLRKMFSYCRLYIWRFFLNKKNPKRVHTELMTHHSV